MAKKPLNIGMIGYGFMGKAHTNAYATVGNFFELEHEPVLKALCARNAEKAQEFADNWGYESVETDWRALIARDDIDAVDICVPNNLHKEISIAAAEAGKMILCEKPIAMDVAEGEAMCEAVEKAGVNNMVWYNYRRVPAVTFAKNIIDSGNLGRIFTIELIFYRIGRSQKICRKVAKRFGDWMLTRLVLELLVTFWRIASIQQSGLMVESKMYLR